MHCAPVSVNSNSGMTAAVHVTGATRLHGWALAADAMMMTDGRSGRERRRRIEFEGIY